VQRIGAAREACEWITGDLDDIARRAGLDETKLSVTVNAAQAAEVAGILRRLPRDAVAATDTAAPLHRADLAGSAAALERVAGTVGPIEP
jgi:hypothetical protein